MPRPLEGLAVSMHGYRLQTHLDFGAVSKLLSCHVVKMLELEVRATEKKITVADGQVSDTFGAVKSTKFTGYFEYCFRFFLIEKPS